MQLLGFKLLLTSVSFATLALGLVPSITPDECANPVRGQCDFYRVCLEPRYQCGPDGYPLGFGEKFCNKFSASEDKLSPEGQEWMLDTMQCLQQALVPDTGVTSSLTATAESCDALKDQAFASHAPCYLQSGLCSLPVTDWIHIVQIIGLDTLIGSWDAVKSTLEAADGCLNFLLFLAI